MNPTWQTDLADAIRSKKELEEIVALLRRIKTDGVSREEAYSFLESLRGQAPDETMEDRILEVADFVAGFCSPHMAVW
jgi:hypothetical protein